MRRQDRGDLSAVQSEHRMIRGNPAQLVLRRFRPTPPKNAPTWNFKYAHSRGDLASSASSTAVDGCVRLPTLSLPRPFARKVVLRRPRSPVLRARGRHPSRRAGRTCVAAATARAARAADRHPRTVSRPCLPRQRHTREPVAAVCPLPLDHRSAWWRPSRIVTTPVAEALARCAPRKAYAIVRQSRGFCGQLGPPDTSRRCPHLPDKLDVASPIACVSRGRVSR